MSINIYFISGLGADRRAFNKLRFPPHFNKIYLDWIDANKNESLESYAARLSINIDLKTPFYLVGLSFGGMLAVEIAKTLNPIHTFIISSIPTATEIPSYFRIVGALRLQKLIPITLLRNRSNLGLKFMGAKSTDEKALLIQLIQSSDPSFIKWALTAILTWKNRERPLNMTHFHGTSDFILPIRFIKTADIIIKNGGHFMVYANAKEMNEHITRLLS